MAKKRTSLPAKTGKKHGSNAPDLDTMFDDRGLPGVPEITGDAETVANHEVDDIMSRIRENRRSNAEHFRDVEAGEFWCCVCFQSQTQRDEFITNLLQKYAPALDIDRFGAKYVSGLELAAMLDVPITPVALEVKKNRLAPKSLRGMEVIK